MLLTGLCCSTCTDTGDRVVLVCIIDGVVFLLTLIWCLFHPMLPQWHVKDPGHSAKIADGRPL